MAACADGADTPLVLVVDDDPDMLDSMAHALEQLDCRLLLAEDGATALELAHVTNGRAGSDDVDPDETPDLLILDRMLPDADGVELLGRLRGAGLSAPAIIVTAHPTLETAVDALGYQACHYLAKPFDPEELVRRAGELIGQRTSVGLQLESAPTPGYLWQTLRERHDFDHVLSHNPRVRQTYAAAARVADTRATVLLQGETGTGKDYLARAIHYMSGRADRHFVPVNCGALPEQLLISELFGHEKGAFTSATQAKTGLAEVADGGTLFLDEIGEMSPDNQVKLLRFSQDLAFTRLGGTETIEVDVRLVCATNRDLAQAVRDGQFREDLYYRLAVVPLQLPPLRERPEDVQPFAQFFLDRHVRTHGRGPRKITGEALEMLRRQRWPGNLRQLENVVQRGVLMATGDTLRPEDLVQAGAGVDAVREASLDNAAGPAAEAGDERLEEMPDLQTVEREHIERVWRASDGNKTRAAQVLGISPRTLSRRLEEYDIE